MKKFFSIFLTILTLTTFIYYLLRYSCAGFSGKITIENSIKKCIMHYGYVNLENVTILENTFVSGFNRPNIHLSSVTKKTRMYKTHKICFCKTTIIFKII